ncbi:SIMPL domain-containing protein [Terrimonas alba]|uniref:SIMPL domain-containing protein n=1 Tax=Terrimonas alba TaxID=3349636 RepID=UPI0035F32CB5
MKKIISLFAIILSSLTVPAQQILQPEEKPNIEVTGSAEMEIVPDEIYINIVLREKNKNNDKFKIEAQEDALLQKLKENGFDINNLSLSGADGNLQYRVFRKNRVLTEKRLLMKVHNAGEVNKLFQLLDELEIEDAGISKTSHSQIEKFRKEIKIEAMKNAKDKADYLLLSIGEQTGKPLVIREQVYTVYPTNQYSNTALHEVVVTDLGRSEAKGLENEIAFTKIKIRYEIFAKFGIK